jgi:glycosyltransferase involved in cell wall biosynthesis
VRIVHVNPFFFPRLGGLERRLYHLARLHAARGHDVAIVCGDGGGTLPAREEMDGFQVVRVPARTLPVRWDPPVQRTRGVGEALRGLDPDVVDFHYRWAPEVTREVVPFCERRGVPYTFTWHNQWGEGRGLLRPLSLLNDRRYRRHLASCFRVIGVSDFISRELVEHGFPAGQVATVPNGAARPRPGSPEWEPDDGRPLPRSPYAVAIGRLTPEKGIDLCVRALAHAVAQGADLRMVVCGRGPLERRLLRLARRLGVDDRLTLAGWIPEGTKWRLLDSAAAYLHMARFESYGISIAEALVAGAPTVVAAVGGTPEVAGDAGVIVPEAGHEEAGAALARLASDPDARAGLRRKALARAPLLSWEAVADRMEALYREAAAAAPVTRG